MKMNNMLYNIQRMLNIIKTDSIFIDDERFPTKLGSQFIVRNHKQFFDYVDHTKKFPEFITFDHDLGEDEKTGYDICKDIVDMHLEGEIQVPKDFTFYVHSQNPVGKNNIEGLLRNFINKAL